MPDNEVQSERFDVPKSPKKQIYQIDRFLGCDFTSAPSAVDVNHSPNCVNFIRMQPGKIRKRTGYYQVAKGTGKVFAIWKWDDDNYIIHIGTTMYHIGRKNTGILDFSVIGGVDTAYSQAIVNTNDTAFVASEKKYAYIRSGDYGLIFGNGEIYFYMGGKYIYTLSNMTLYTPIVTISKKPQGGGASYEPFNLINSAFTESFYVSAEDNTEDCFEMSYSDLESIEKVEVMDANGVFQETTAYTADLTDGTITFDNPPGKSPAEGEDNVRITAKKTFSGYASRITNCTFATAYGMNGNYDRVFISGNPDYPNYDWFSEMDDITYFPDTSYSVLGSDASPIKGYAIVSNMLVTLKGNGTDRQAAIIREGSFDDQGNPMFVVKKSLQGYPTISPDTSVVAGIEPMFLTEEGIMAITSSDLYGEKTMNVRSFYLNGKLLNEPNLDKSFAIRHGDYYMLFVNDQVYILDTLQTITTENTPYSTRQYATFYWDNVPATCAASIDNTIFFGTKDGDLMAFATDLDDLNSYSDNGTAIRCVYETADIDSIIFFKNKTYRFVATRVFPARVSSLKLWALKEGIWDLIKEDTGTIRYFTFSHLKFSEFTFKTDTGTQLVTSKVRIKKMDHVRFKLENDRNYQPLMIDTFGIEYTQAGNHKN
jgi:hypothetical protein